MRVGRIDNKVREALVQQKVKVEERGNGKNPFPSQKQGKHKKGGGAGGQKRRKPNLTFDQVIAVGVCMRCGKKGKR